MPSLHYAAVLDGTETREQAIPLVESLAAALKIEVSFPPPTIPPGDIPG